MKYFYVTFLLFATLQIGCNSSGTDSPEEWNARIEPSKGIDSVKFGDSKETVLTILGPSDRGGIADGLYSSWFVSDYLKGPHAGLSVYFLEDPINSLGPVDILTIEAPYSGKTNEGIGIGSSVAEVRSSFGEPQNIYDNYSSDKGMYTYVYCFKGKRMQIGFKENKIHGIGLGYYKSPPNNECQ